MTDLRSWIDGLEDDPEYWFDRLNIAIGEEIVARMEALQLNRSALAKRMGVSKARVTQVLAGDENLTLKTLVRVATALDASISMDLEPRSGMLHHAWYPFDADHVQADDSSDSERDFSLIA